MKPPERAAEKGGSNRRLFDSVRALMVGEQKGAAVKQAVIRLLDQKCGTKIRPIARRLFEKLLVSINSSVPDAFRPVVFDIKLDADNAFDNVTSHILVIRPLNEVAPKLSARVLSNQPVSLRSQSYIYSTSFGRYCNILKKVLCCPVLLGIQFHYELPAVLWSSRLLSTKLWLSNLLL